MTPDSNDSHVDEFRVFANVAGESESPRVALLQKRRQTEGGSAYHHLRLPDGAAGSVAPCGVRFVAIVVEEVRCGMMW